MANDLRLVRRVRAELTYHHVSAREMASRIGLSQSALSSRLTGDVDFRFSELRAIADSLGVPLDTLLPADPAGVA